MRSRLSYRVATARNCLSLAKQRSTVLRLVYQEASKAGGRPPARPRSRRCFFWSSLTGITAWMPCRRSQARFAREEYALSAIARPGRCRGLPRPRRGMRIASISGTNRGESPCWPQLVSRAMGRHRRSAARWILVVSPPRDRPIPSRADFLSFATAPRGVISSRDAAGAGRVLMGPGDGGVRADCPVLALGLVAPGPQPVQDLLPGPVQRPAAMPVIHGLPVPEALRQVPPRAPCPGPEEDPVDHRPVIGPPAAALLRAGRQEHPKALPFLIGQVMTIQSVRHRTGLHDPALKIHGTRPTGHALTGLRPSPARHVPGLG